jgi:histone deacetylase 1/2
MPITSIGSTTLTPHRFHLNHVLVSPAIIKSLISVRKFTRGNSCSMEFDPYGFSVKDLATRNILLRSSSSGELYPFFGNLQSPGAALSVSTTRDLWHRRLGHPSDENLSRISSSFPFPCNRSSDHSSVCEACKLGKQPRLSFSSSSSFTTLPFQLIHCDLWTSPIPSFTGYKYYLIILDDYSHYSWVFPLRNKSDTASTLERFFVYIRTQFHTIIKCLQCDNGGSFLQRPYVPSSPPMVFLFASRVHIPHLRMEKPKGCCIPLMMPSALFLSKHLSLLSFGSRLFIQQINS